MSSERQGHLGSLSERPTEDLKDLLRRQEMLMQNKKFIDGLPDKGNKITSLIDRLKRELESRDTGNVDETARLFHKMALGAARTRLGEDGREISERDSDEMSTLQQIVNTSDKNKMIVDERTEQVPNVCNSYEKVIKKSESKPQHKAKFFPNKTSRTSNVHAVKKELEQQNLAKPTRDVITLDDELTPQLSSQYSISNNINRIKGTEQNMDSNSNKSSHLKTSDNGTGTISSPDKIDEINSRLQPMVGVDTSCDTSVASNKGKSGSKAKCVSRHKTLQDIGVKDQGGSSRLKYRYDESLEKSPHVPPVRHKGVQIVSLQESIDLLRSQTERLEKLHAEQAAERLATRFGTNMVNPEGSALNKYREVVDTDSDSCDEDNQADFLD